MKALREKVVLDVCCLHACQRVVFMSEKRLHGSTA